MREPERVTKQEEVKSDTEQESALSEEEEPTQQYRMDQSTPKVMEESVKGAVSGFSLSSIALKKAAQKKELRENKTENLPEDNFDKATLIKVWSNYITILKKEGKQNIASIMEMKVPELKEGASIHFTVANALNKVELTQEMEHLLPFLRTELNHFNLEINLNIAESIQEESVFTPQEKYQYLLKINPTLDTLRKKFDLDF